MSEPAPYHGRCERLFKRAETAGTVGREIGLQYVHAHLRYAEAMAKTGDAEERWWVLQVCNPVGLAHVVPHAAPRQGVSIFSTRTPGSGVCLALTARDRNPYGIGGWRVPAAERSALLSPERNLVEIEL